MKKLLSYFIENPYEIFRLDGFGAVLSATALGLACAFFQPLFGMPTDLLVFLFIFPCLFAMYDLLCYLRKPDVYHFCLKAVILMNGFYCLLSIGIVKMCYEKLTTFGLTYFSLELAVLFLLIVLQIRIFRAYPR